MTATAILAVIGSLLLGAVVVAIPIFAITWLLMALVRGSTEDVTSDTSELLLGGLLSLVAGLLITINETVFVLGEFGTLLAEFPNLLAYGAALVGTPIGLVYGTDLSVGASVLIGLVLVIVTIMIVEGAGADE